MTNNDYRDQIAERLDDAMLYTAGKFVRGLEMPMSHLKPFEWHRENIARNLDDWMLSAGANYVRGLESAWKNPS